MHLERKSRKTQTDLILVKLTLLLCGVGVFVQRRARTSLCLESFNQINSNSIELRHCHCRLLSSLQSDRIQHYTQCCWSLYSFILYVICPLPSPPLLKGFTSMKALIEVNFQFIRYYIYMTIERAYEKKTPSIYLIKLLTLESHAIQL